MHLIHMVMYLIDGVKYLTATDGVMYLSDEVKYLTDGPCMYLIDEVMYLTYGVMYLSD